MPETPGRNPFDNERNTGWSGEIDWPPAQDRSRSRNPLPPLPEEEGLRKFDLGMVPASVTPPRSWRRAAWFSIASAVAVLGGLLSASTLINSPPQWEGLDLPGMPREDHWALLAPTSTQPDPLKAIGQLPRPTARPAPERAPDPSRDQEGGAHSPGRGRPSGRESQPVTTDEPGIPGSGDGQGTGSATPTTPPPTSEELQLVSFSDAKLVLQRSDQYFSAVTGGDLRSAYALTTGSLRAEGFEKFAARYSHASSIEVLEVRTASSRTITTLRIVGRDGSERTERRELRFTPGRNPLIESDERSA